MEDGFAPLDNTQNSLSESSPTSSYLVAPRPLGRPARGLRPPLTAKSNSGPAMPRSKLRPEPTTEDNSLEFATAETTNQAQFLPPDADELVAKAALE